MLRVSGKRTFAQLTPFDLVLLLIISEVTEPALMPEEQASFGGVLLSITALCGRPRDGLGDVALALARPGGRGRRARARRARQAHA